MTGYVCLCGWQPTALTCCTSLPLCCCRYEFEEGEWQDALEHAMESGRDTKVLLRMA